MLLVFQIINYSGADNNNINEKSSNLSHEIITTVPEQELDSSITKCVNITKEGYFFLKNSLNHSNSTRSATCITISSSNVVFDCKNKKLIDDKYTDQGILIEGVSNVTVKNCLIENFWSSINVYDSNNIILENNSLRRFANGLYLFRSKNLTANNNYFESSGPGGVIGGKSFQRGIYSYNLKDSYFGNNKIKSTGVGIEVKGGENNYISNNKIQNTLQAIVVVSKNNIISENIINQTKQQAMIIKSELSNNFFDNTTLTNNIAVNCGWDEMITYNVTSVNNSFCQ